MREQTVIWQEYEAGLDFNHRVEDDDYDYYDKMELNINYVEGRQWLGLENNEFPKAEFNLENRFVNLFNSVLCSAATGINLEPFQTIDNENQMRLADMAKAAIESFQEMTNFDAFKRYAIRDCEIMGDIAAHYYFNPKKKTALGEMGEIEREYVYGNNVFLGNPNSDIISKEVQPYVLIAGRDLVKNLKEEAKENGNDPDLIRSDTARDSVDFDSYEESTAKGFEKATYVLKYYFKDDKLLVSKSCQFGMVFNEIETNQERYPIAWLIWEKKYNNYHGKAFVEDLHHTQNYINRSFAMMMYWTMSLAYGKYAYDADRIKGWTNDLTMALPIRGRQANESINNMVTNIAPTQMSGYIIQCIELAVKYMKESVGISDALLGNVDPENKGAIVVATKNTQAPLENQKERIRQWTEDQVLILLDIMIAKYGERNVLVKTEEGNMMESFDFDSLKDVPFNVNIEIGDASYFSEVGLQQTLDNLFASQLITAQQYLERLPENLLPNKQEILDELKGAMPEDDSDQLMEIFEQLPPEQQQQIAALPPEQQADAMRQLI